MKRSALFDEFLAKVDYATKREVDFNSDIAYRIDCILKRQGITQRDLAKKMGKKESEISRWISGRHGFKTSTIAKLEAALGEHLIEVTQEDNCQAQVVSAD